MQNRRWKKKTRCRIPTYYFRNSRKYWQGDQANKPKRYRKIMLGFARSQKTCLLVSLSLPRSWNRAPETFVISWITGFFCSNEATLNGLLKGCWMRASHQKRQAVIRSLESSALVPHFLEKGEGLNVDLLINTAYVKKTQ